MANYSVKSIENRDEWEKAVLSFAPQTFLQGWSWGQTNVGVGAKVIRLGFCQDDKTVGVAQIIKEKARRGPYLLIPGGPLLDWSNQRLVKFVVDHIRDLAQKEKVWFIRIRPEVPDSFGSKKAFLKLGFLPAPMHLHAENTWVLDITPEEETLLQGMRKTTRYLIRQSLKENLTFEEYTHPNGAEILCTLQKETAARHKFSPYPKKLFEAELASFKENQEGSLFVCKYGKDVLAAAIIIFYGHIAYYHHSASTLIKYPKVPFSYFLQWHIIKEAKKRNARTYNFWGIAPSDNPKHRFAGVTTFKKGFGGERIDWLQAQDLPVSPFYWLTYIFETLRRITRRL